MPNADPAVWQTRLDLGWDAADDAADPWDGEALTRWIARGLVDGGSWDRCRLPGRALEVIRSRLLC